MIFQEFARLDRTGGDAERGLGLGLAIVERIARMLNSPIDLHSSLGHGSIFSITVPRAAVEPAQPAQPQAAPTPVAGSLSGSFVLCIDNEIAVREAMTTLLEGWSCTVAAVPSIEEARRAVAAAGRSPDVILADLHLDEASPDGLDAITMLRRDWGQQLPAILITADRSQDMRQRAAAIQVDVLVAVSLLVRPRSRDLEQAAIFVSGGEGLPAAAFAEADHDPRIDELRALAARFIGCMGMVLAPRRRPVSS